MTDIEIAQNAKLKKSVRLQKVLDLQRMILSRTGSIRLRLVWKY